MTAFALACAIIVFAFAAYAAVAVVIDEWLKTTWLPVIKRPDGADANDLERFTLMMGWPILLPLFALRRAARRWFAPKPPPPPAEPGDTYHDAKS